MRLGLKVWLGITLGAAFAMFGAIGPAAADRPGTPNNLAAHDCGGIYEDGAETVCGSFTSTSTEKVIYESQITENGKPAGPGLVMDCPRQNFVYPNVCVNVGKWHDHEVVEYMVTHAKFDTTYCIAFRARRVSDQMVSELWSNQDCVHTAPRPPPPAKPTIAVRYLPPAPDSLGNITQPAVEITFDQVTRATNQQVYFSPNEPLPSHNGTWIYSVPPITPGENDHILSIEVCDTNVSGKACSSRVIDATAQRDIKIDGALPIKITGRRPGDPPLPPRPTSGFDGMWDVTTDQQTAFTMNMMLVAGATMGAFTTTPNPADKLDMHGRLVDPTHAEMSFKEPGHIVFGTIVVTGTLGITLSNDGKSFVAIAQYSNNTTSVWRGTKTTPAPAR
jgi:hypothetical protein